MITPLVKFRKEIIKNKLDALLISSIPNIIYLTNFPGFTTDEREAFLLIYKNEQYFITDARSSGTVRNHVKDFDLVEISTDFQLETALKDLVIKHKIEKLGIEENNLTVSEYKKIKKCFKCLSHFSADEMRAIKDSSEIIKIEKACKLGDKAFAYILRRIKLGISEKELANEIELFIKRNGAGVSFATIVAFGKNSAIPHHVPSDRKLKTDNIVLLDFGVKLNGYCSDMTRTVFFGTANKDFKKMHNTVSQAQQKAIKFLVSTFNPLASDTDKVARDYIVSKGYPTIPHSLGHGIGLQIHESPRLSLKSKDILKEGMVFSIEPGIYIPNFAGVRIEDLVVLEKNNLPRSKAGLRLLTRSPKTLIEL